MAHFLKVVPAFDFDEKFRKKSKTTNFSVILSHEIYKYIR